MMPAGLHRRHASEAHTSDAGFTLVEILVSIMLIGIIMAGLATFFVSSVSVTTQQTGRQAATQLAEDAAEQVRALKGSAVSAGRAQCGTSTPCTTPVTGVTLGDIQEWDYPDGNPTTLPIGPSPVKINGVTFNQIWYVGKCWQATVG